MTVSPFFGGSGSDLGTVTALTPQTFADFVKETLGNPALIKLATRAEFRALPKEKRDLAKRVAYFTPAAFKTAPSRRNWESGLHCNLVCIDIDDSKDAGPFFVQPNSLAELLHPFAFAAYTTANSTPEAPRLRIVVKAERLPLESYAQAARYVGEKLLHLPKITTESKNAVLPMFVPTLFRDDNPEESHPLIIAVPEGEAVTASVVAGAAFPSANRGTDSEDISGDALVFLRPQVEGITLEDALSALEHLDPDCSYPEWINVATALKHQFGEEGLEVFDLWSSRGRKYPGEEDVAKKWQTFRANPRGRLPVTIRSLLKKATEAGWNRAEAVALRCYEETRNWLRASQPVKTLMEQGIQRIVGTPLSTDIQRAALLTDLKDALMRGGVRVSVTDLKSSLQKFERQLAQQQATAPTVMQDKKVPKWAVGMTYVADQNEFFQRHTGRKFSIESLDNTYAVQLMTPADEGKALPSVRPKDYLLNRLVCPRADSYAYDPSATESIIKAGHKKFVNLYVPTHPEPDPSRAAYASEIVLRHAKHLIREPQYVDLLISYFAYMVQNPGKKIRWVPLLQGAFGCGKTVFAEMMRYVLGVEHVQSITPDQVFDSQYNPWAFGKMLTNVEEVRVVGHDRYELMNKIKACITNDFITINDKWVKPFQTKNTTNYFMSTNYQDALAVSKDERRYFVIYSRFQTRSQVLAAFSPAYFDTLYTTIQQEAAGLRYWLENYRLSPQFNAEGRAPVTPYFLEMAKASSSPLAAAVGDLVHEGRHILVQPDIVSATTLMGLLDQMRLPPYTAQAVHNVLREIGYDAYSRIYLDGISHHMFVHRTSEMTDEVMRDLVRSRVDNAELV